VRAGADANRGNLQSGRYGSATSSGIASRTTAKAPESSSGDRIESQFLRRLFIARLSAHSSQAMNVLRREADMTHDGKAGRRPPSDSLGDRSPPSGFTAAAPPS